MIKRMDSDDGRKIKKIKYYSEGDDVMDNECDIDSYDEDTSSYDCNDDKSSHDGSGDKSSHDGKDDKSSLSDVHFSDLNLLMAAKCGAIDEARTSLAEGVDINITDEDGRTPLYHACQNGHFELADFLLKNEANISLGESPLIAAVRYKHVQCVALLLQSGADMNVASSDGETAFTLACKIQNIPLAECFFVHGVEEPCPRSMHLLMFKHNIKLRMKKLLFYYGARDNSTYVIDSLLKHSPEIVNCRKRGKTALYNAAQNGNVVMMHKLVSHGAILDVKNYNASTPLHVACKNGHCDAVEYLLGAGATVDPVDTEGRTPLFYAAASAKINILQLLLVSGASVNALDNNGRNAMAFGYKKNRSNYVKVVNYFLKHIPDVKSDRHCQNFLIVAARRNHYSMVELLLRSGVDPNHSNRWGGTALGKACVNSYTDIVKLLLEFNADPNFCSVDVQPHKFYSLALHTAARRGDISIVKLLLEHGANVNLMHSSPPSFNKWDRPPLMYALKNIYPEISHLDSMASIEDALTNRLNVVEMLLEMGADANVSSYVNGYWKSALYIAIDKLRISNIRKYIGNLSLELDNLRFAGFSEVRSVDENFKNFAETVLTTRIKVIKLLVDHNLLLNYDLRSELLAQQTYQTCDLDVLIPLDKGCESVILYLFQAGADFKLLSGACGILKQELFFEYNVKSVNFFKTLVLNGLKVNMMDFKNLKNSDQQSQKEKCFLEMLTWYRKQQQIPLSCSQLCRIKIRKQLLLATNSRSILKSIDKLVLPAKLKSYLKFEGFHNEFDLSTSDDIN